MTLILAGGEGRRMNGDKPLRMLGGHTLLTRTINYAEGLGFPIMLSLRSPDQIGAALDLSIVEDRRDIEGPLAGIAAGIDRAKEGGFDAMLTIPIDMPWLPDDLAHRLSSEASEKPAFAASGGWNQPVCALWPVACQNAVERYAAKGGRSLHGLLEELAANAVEWPVGDQDPFANINDPAALAEAERQLQKPR